MKILLLAAGRGTRISRVIEGKPKCCVLLNQETLIKNTLDKLIKLGFKEIAIATGYKSDVIKKETSEFLVKYYHNPFFGVTNSISTLWFARDFFDDNDEDIYIMNADVFFESEILSRLIYSNKNVTFLADSSKKIGADYKFYWENNKLLKFGKELSIDETSGEYVGIGKISKNFVSKFLNKLNILIDSELTNIWWEDVLYDFVKDPNEEINILDLKGEKFWAEIDYVEDYNKILNYIKNNDTI